MHGIALSTTNYYIDYNIWITTLRMPNIRIIIMIKLKEMHTASILIRQQ